MLEGGKPDPKTFLFEILKSDNYVVNAISSDGTNLHYRITLRSPYQHYFLKVFITNSLQVVNRQQQFQIQLQLAQQGLAPKPIALSTCGNYWLEHWCSPELPDLKQQKGLDVPGVLATAMASIHQCRVSAPDLDIKAEWLRYMAVAGDSSLQYSEKINHLLSAYGSEHKQPEDFCFCHNDLHWSHVLQVKPLRIIDWEYSATGNRYFDLAACIMVNEFDKKQSEAFIDRYSMLTGIFKSTVVSGIKHLLPVVDFTNKLWHNAYNTIS